MTSPPNISVSSHSQDTKDGGTKAVTVHEYFSIRFPLHLYMTLDEFKTDWREKEKQPHDPNVKITCICGKHNVDFEPLSDEILEHIYNLLQDDNNKLFPKP